MKIALDWDDTVTRDPALWLNFARNAMERGHDIRVVTMRFESELADVRQYLSDVGVKLPIIPTSRRQKREFCDEYSWMPDVWIDDTPEFIVSHIPIFAAPAQPKEPDNG